MQKDRQIYLAQELARTIKQFKKVGGQSESRRGIRPSEFMLLHILMHCVKEGSGEMKVSELSAKLQITPGGVTHLINSLEEGGYVERLPDPSDRRVVLVKLTARGKENMESFYARHMENLQGLVDFLGERDSMELNRLLALALNYYKEKRWL